MFASGPTGIFLEFIRAIEIGLITAGVHAGADAKAVNRCAGGHQRLDGILVEIPAGEDVDLGQTAGIENSPDLAGMLRQITTIQSHGSEFDTLWSQALQQRHQGTGGGPGVVGVDEQAGVTPPIALPATGQ